ALPLRHLVGARSMESYCGPGSPRKRGPRAWPEVPVSKLFFEDFNPGRVFKSKPRRVSAEEIVEFATEFDPQPFHLDDAAARETMFGGLAASGWHSCCIIMRLIADSFLLNASSMGAGAVDEVRWLVPIRPDDVVTLRSTVIETRASNSRPDRGFVKFSFEL